MPAKAVSQTCHCRGLRIPAFAGMTWAESSAGVRQPMRDDALTTRTTWNGLAHIRSGTGVPRDSPRRVASAWLETDEAAIGAARDYLADSDEAIAFLLMNRQRDWGTCSSSGEGARRRPGKR
jgi:hypothetical protein